MPLPPEFHELAKRVNNWGRWGADDEIGTLNFIDAAKRRDAAALVRHGKCFSLSIPLHKDGLQTGLLPGRINPVRTMIDIHRPMTGDPTQFCNSDDMVVTGLQSATHWDGLAHVSYAGRMYNGYPLDSVDADGASRCGIHKIETLLSRGVLLDVAAAKGAERLEPGYPISCEDLDAAEELAKLEIARGDIVLVRTGQMQLLKQQRVRPRDKAAYAKPCPGVTLATTEWFHQRDVAAVAADNFSLEVYPGVPEDMFLPVHLIHIVEMGMTQGQNWDLEELAADCADDGVYEFLLEASPQRFVGAVGSMVNPVATK